MGTSTYTCSCTILDRGQVYRWISPSGDTHLHLFLYYTRQGTGIGGYLLVGTSTYTFYLLHCIEGRCRWMSLCADIHLHLFRSVLHYIEGRCRWMSLCGDIHLHLFLYYTRQGTGIGGCLFVGTSTYTCFCTTLHRGQVQVDVSLWGHPPTPVSLLHCIEGRCRWMSPCGDIHLHQPVSVLHCIEGRCRWMSLCGDIHLHLFLYQTA